MRNDVGIWREAHRRARRALGYLDKDQEHLVHQGLAADRVRSMRPSTIRRAVVDAAYLHRLLIRSDYTRGVREPRR